MKYIEKNDYNETRKWEGYIMTKNQMISALSAETGFQSKEIVKVLDAFRTLIMKELKTSKECKLLELGKIKVVHREARMGRNPMTGKTIKIPAKNAVKFSFSKDIKEQFAKK